MTTATAHSPSIPHPYLPANHDDADAMLAAIGVDSMEDLLTQIPADVRLERPLDMPPAMPEMALQRHVAKLARRNVSASDRVCFAGGGAYDHFIPAVVDEIAGRGEWYTAYTPYQAEASQGTLQAVFEFQTLISNLTGMEVANASLYEAATGVVEAVLMAMRVTRRTSRVVIAGDLNPQYVETLRTYLTPMACEMAVVPSSGGRVDPAAVEEAVDPHTAAVVFQSPNVLGGLEAVADLSAAAHEGGALAVAVVNPISLGIVKRPGDCDVDICIAEGQTLGNPLNFGGPYLGIFACREKYVRTMPGRLVSRTSDRDGRDCFVLGLQTREQHIRRDKATSNICSNQGLMALRATVFLALHGPQGLREMAERSCRLAHRAAAALTDGTGLSLQHEGPFFNEFVLTGDDLAGVQVKARDAGYDLGPRLTDLGMDTDGLLVAVTEQRTEADISGLAAALRG